MDVPCIRKATEDNCVRTGTQEIVMETLKVGV
jgi:hypothetical protein